MPTQTSLGRLLSARGIDDWDAMLKAICEKCPVKTSCDTALKTELISGCRSLTIINLIAMNMVNRSEAGRPTYIMDFAKIIRDEIEHL